MSTMYEAIRRETKNAIDRTGKLRDELKAIETNPDYSQQLKDKQRQQYDGLIKAEQDKWEAAVSKILDDYTATMTKRAKATTATLEERTYAAISGLQDIEALEDPDSWLRLYATAATSKDPADLARKVELRRIINLRYPKDSYTNWEDVRRMHRTDAERTAVEVLKEESVMRGSISQIRHLLGMPGGTLQLDVIFARIENNAQHGPEPRLDF